MKNVKRLSVLVALILCVTVGGVYATWTYAQSSGVTENINKGVSLSPYETSGTLGIYTVDPSEFLILIDQTAVGDYTPKLDLSLASPDVDGTLNFKFTPNNTASDEIKTNGITSWVLCESAIQHESQDVFTFPKDIKIGTVGSGEDYVWVKQPDGTFTCEIPHSDLPNYIQLAYTNKLDTLEKYNAMLESLKGKSISVTIFTTASTVAP